MRSFARLYDLGEIKWISNKCWTKTFMWVIFRGRGHTSYGARHSCNNVRSRSVRLSLHMRVICSPAKIAHEPSVYNWFGWMNQWLRSFLVFCYYWDCFLRSDEKHTKTRASFSLSTTLGECEREEHIHTTTRERREEEKEGTNLFRFGGYEVWIVHLQACD